MLMVRTVGWFQAGLRATTERAGPPPPPPPPPRRKTEGNILGLIGFAHTILRPKERTKHTKIGQAKEAAPEGFREGVGRF